MWEDIDDFPMVGVTPFDAWMSELAVIHVAMGLMSVTDLGTGYLDRDHWLQYFEVGYTPREAVYEDLTCYGEE